MPTKPSSSASAADPAVSQQPIPIERCWWCGDDPLYTAYHDEEWGRPVVDDTRLFEKISLEGFQAGLSWLTILRKRDNFRRAFAGFDPARVARFNRASVNRLLADASIVRHRGKIEATINNARLVPAIVDEFGSLAAYLWSFQPPPRAQPPRTPQDIPTTCPRAIALSTDLRHRGWRFVGPTTMYAFMQAMGMVNDHLISCTTRTIIEEQHRTFTRPCPA